MNNINLENINLFLKDSWNYNEYDNDKDINNTNNINNDNNNKKKLNNNNEKYKKILSVKDTVKVLKIYLKDNSIEKRFL